MLLQIYGNKKNYFNIDSKIDPISPYAVSKAAGYWLTKIYLKIMGYFVVLESYLIMSHR